MQNDQPIVIKVLNGQSTGKAAGKDVQNHILQISGSALYEILNFQQASTGTLELITTAPGVEVYTFTFGP